MGVGLFFRFAEADFAFDLDVLEAMFEVEADDFRALGGGGAVGDEGEPNSALLQLVEGFEGAGD